jgi:universal stress protein E
VLPPCSNRRWHRDWQLCKCLAAENKAGLVVLGTVGRKKLVGRVLGNTAEQILRLLKADVLAIKP